MLSLGELNLQVSTTSVYSNPTCEVSSSATSSSTSNSLSGLSLRSASRSALEFRKPAATLFALFESSCCMYSNPTPRLAPVTSQQDPGCPLSVTMAEAWNARGLLLTGRQKFCRVACPNDAVQNGDLLLRTDIFPQSCQVLPADAR